VNETNEISPLMLSDKHYLVKFLTLSLLRISLEQILNFGRSYKSADYET